MPEGHTVHRMAREQQELVGRRLSVTSPQGRFREGAARLDGRRLRGVEAHGKHLFHHFDSDAHLHVHLGMQGRFLRDVTGRAPVANARVRIEDGHVAWELVAPATCEVLDDGEVTAVRCGLGPDPLRADADSAAVHARLIGIRRAIGEVLLDQSVLAGVGNVFRAEVLFACAVHPRRPAASLSGAELTCLWDTLRAMMARAVEDGRILTVPVPSGTDRDSLPESETRFVYKQQQCRRCGSPVESETIAGRISYACPTCQPLVGAHPAAGAPRRGG